MSKKIARDDQTVVLYGVDLSTSAARWSVSATAGDIIRLELDLYAPFVRTQRIKPDNVKSDRFATNRANIYVSGNGVQWSDNIGKHVYAWDAITNIGHEDIVRLYLYADSEFMSINGGAPWEHQ